MGNLTPIIPAPARLRPSAGEFRLVPGATIAYRDPILAPLARRFAQDAARRCRIALKVGAGERAPAIVIDLGDDPDLAGLPAPLGLDPAGPPRDERYALTVDRFVTLLPEIDTPGHGLALLRLRPELGNGRNLVRPGHPHQSAWLDPELPATFEVLDAALAELAGLFPGPFLHIGGDEPYGMPDQAYGVYVRRLKQAARALGKRTVGWQESIRAGADPGHVIQYWMDASSLGVGGEAPVPPEVAARVTANYRRARTDLEQALAHGVPVIVSPQAHCYQYGR
ncbi:MAG TPA: family 20 glycosylhydrolase [Streptosporangiaceae bacterium]|nr:family 20 glycosylhydrolase [Streptosporangiaceae bacterium]